MNKGYLFAAISGLIAFSGVFLLVLWGFKYNYLFGVCKITSYNIAPGLNCDFTSRFSLCDSTYCSNLYVSFTDYIASNNYTGFIPVTFEEHNIGYRDCWNLISYSNLKSNLQEAYPIGSAIICYVSFKNEIILSNYSFYKLSHSLKVAGIILTVIGKFFLFLYLLYRCISLSIRKPVYEVI